MVSGGNTSYRIEQMRAIEILKELYTKSEIETEYVIRNLTIDGKKTSPAIVDIVIKPQKIAIRLNGEIHTKSASRRKKDENQKIALEEAGWKVVDFWYYKLPNLWTRNKYTEEIRKKAREEIIKCLQ
jgi:very-short-patch-repair endonuclease